jgi:hypothetical protein
MSDGPTLDEWRALAAKEVRGAELCGTRRKASR